MAVRVLSKTIGLLGFAINFMFLKAKGYPMRWRGTNVET
jgi:hypothetical protein